MNVHSYGSVHSGGGEHLLCILQLFHPWLGAFAIIIIVKGIIIFAVT